MTTAARRQTGTKGTTSREEKRKLGKQRLAEALPLLRSIYQQTGGRWPVWAKVAARLDRLGLNSLTILVRAEAKKTAAVRRG